MRRHLFPGCGAVIIARIDCDWRLVFSLPAAKVEKPFESARIKGVADGTFGQT
jgi:hypothetical protein